MNKANKFSTTSIFWAELKNTIATVIMVLTMMSILLTVVVYDVIENNITSILERTLVVAWSQYNEFFRKSTDSFYLLGQPEVDSDIDVIKKLFADYHDYDFWFIAEGGRAVEVSGTPGAYVPDSLLQVARQCREKKTIVTSSELFALADFVKFHPAMDRRNGSKIITEPDMPIMAQVAAFPVLGNSGPSYVIVAGKILNDDDTIVNSIDNLIPGTNSTISVRNGLRVAGNLRQISHEQFIGKFQDPGHIDQVYNGKRYYGHIIIDELDDRVISEPIYNSRGQIIGALTTGFPYVTFSDLKIKLTLYILAIAAASFLLAVSVSMFLSHQGATPIVNLSAMSKEISTAEEITERHIAKLSGVRPAELTEIRDLQQSFLKMAVSLLGKNLETQKYMTELSEEHDKLLRLTNELQRLNLLLENKVEERTKELYNAVSELKELSGMKSKFLANVSHEIRTPLNSIIGFSDVLGEELFGQLNDKQKEYIGNILNSANHLLQIINDILDMSIIDYGNLSIHKRPEYLNALINAAVSIMQGQAERKNIRITCALEENVPATMFDPVRIKQVLYNIISNAIKFTPAGGSICVASSYGSAALTISVSDTGIGIAKEVQDKVFDEFYQAENIYERPIEGVGLGLPLSKKIMEIHGGAIKLSSEQGKGTTVKIIIPA
ncbi:MAG: cache domain-containing protein [Acidaminococcales bacterium]|jgi:signal transduction histidine kinase|nr:cache domain-containing protein [Acidaminococcales bacterium]